MKNRMLLVINRCIICERVGDHNTVCMSDIVMYDDDYGFPWRIYWTEDDWGTYIVDESGQKFDFWKSKDFEMYSDIVRPVKYKEMNLW